MAGTRESKDFLEVQCPHCGAGNPEAMKFCGGCGGALSAAPGCPGCGAGNPAGFRFCGQCGASLTAAFSGRGAAALPGATAPPSVQAAVRTEPERRQLTVVFCDIVGSTALSAQLDPEDYRELILFYQRTGAAIVRRYGGCIAQYLGDGMLIYFGYPAAEADDAQRAVRAALHLLTAIKRHPPPADLGLTEPLSIRIAAHTGVVVVTGMPETESGAKHFMAFGATLNIAARLQHVAPPNSLVVSEATRRLVDSAFDCEAIGLYRVKGLAQPVPVFRVTGDARRLKDEPPPRPLAGRREELERLRRLYRAASGGAGQAVLLSGEPGIGKSCLVRALRAELAKAAAPLWLTGHCSSYGRDSALLPVIELIRKGFGMSAQAGDETALRQMEAALAAAGLPAAEAVPLFAALLSLPLPDRYPLPPMEPQHLKRRMLTAVRAWIAAEAQRRPVVLEIEDLQWADASTLEFLQLLLPQIPSLPVLLLLTRRSDGTAAAAVPGLTAELTLDRLEPESARQIVTDSARGKTLPEPVMELLLTKAGGVPLFLEELTRMVLDTGALAERPDRYAPVGELSVLDIPSSLRGLLMARLDRLGPAREVAQLAAVIGRSFEARLLRAAWACEAGALEAGVDALVEADLLLRRGEPPETVYRFKHALIQEVAYDSLLKRQRRRHHHRIAEVLARDFPDTVKRQPELLAHHASAAGDYETAVTHWLQAGQRANERSAGIEAIAHLNRGLADLDRTPASAAQEARRAALYLALAVPLIATQGWASPKVEDAFVRARRSVVTLNDLRLGFAVLRGLFNVVLIRGEMIRACELAEQILQAAQRGDNADLSMLAYHTNGLCRFLQARFTEAQDFLAAGNRLYDPARHRIGMVQTDLDPGVAGTAIAAWVDWFIGRPEEALAKMDRAIAFAEEARHHFSLAFVHGIAASLHQLRRDPEAALGHADTAIAVSIEYGYPYWRARAAIVRGWAIAVGRSRPDEGTRQLHDAIELYEATGARQSLPYALTLLAEAYGAAGQPATALPIVREALRVQDSTGVSFMAVETLRIEGGLLAALGRPKEAESSYRTAIDRARRQQAPLLEIRAQADLDRHLATARPSADRTAAKKGRRESGRPPAIRRRAMQD